MKMCMYVSCDSKADQTTSPMLYFGTVLVCQVAVDLTDLSTKNISLLQMK